QPRLIPCFPLPVSTKSKILPKIREAAVDDIVGCSPSLALNHIRSCKHCGREGNHHLRENKKALGYNSLVKSLIRWPDSQVFDIGILRDNRRETRLLLRTMQGPHHRKIELQSVADLSYLYANAVALSRQKLDLHFPLSATNGSQKPDPMKERVKVLV